MHQAEAVRKRQDELRGFVNNLDLCAEPTRYHQTNQLAALALADSLEVTPFFLRLHQLLGVLVPLPITRPEEKSSPSACSRRPPVAPCSSGCTRCEAMPRFSCDAEKKRSSTKRCLKRNGTREARNCKWTKRVPSSGGSGLGDPAREQKMCEQY